MFQQWMFYMLLCVAFLVPGMVNLAVLSVVDRALRWRKPYKVIGVATWGCMQIGIAYALLLLLVASMKVGSPPFAGLILTLFLATGIVLVFFTLDTIANKWYPNDGNEGWNKGDDDPDCDPPSSPQGPSTELTTHKKQTSSSRLFRGLCHIPP